MYSQKGYESDMANKLSVCHINSPFFANRLYKYVRKKGLSLNITEGNTKEFVKQYMLRFLSGSLYDGFDIYDSNFFKSAFDNLCRLDPDIIGVENLILLIGKFTDYIIVNSPGSEYDAFSSLFDKKVQVDWASYKLQSLVESR